MVLFEMMWWTHWNIRCWFGYVCVTDSAIFPKVLDKNLKIMYIELKQSYKQKSEFYNV